MLTPRPEGPRPGEPLVACPDCSSTLPFAGLVALTSYVIRKGRMVGYHSGQRVSCQACGSVFSIGPAGTFRQHPLALPFQQMPMPEPEAPRLSGPDALERASARARTNYRTEQAMRGRGPLTPKEKPPA